MSSSTSTPCTSYARCQGKACIKEQRRQCCNTPGSSVSVVQQLVAACTGAIATSLLMTPMDVVKIRLQRQAQAKPSGQCFYYHNGLMDHICTPCEMKQPCEWYQRPGNFNGTLDAFVKISRTEGIRSLWSGLSPTLVMAIPATVFYFSVYDRLLIKLRKKICCRQTLQPELWCPPDWTAAMVAGATARTISVTIVSPIEMVRTKMQSEQLSYKDVGKAVRSSFATRGFSSFYLGWAPTLMRDIPFSAVYWAGYDGLKTRVLRWRGLSETTFATSFLCGATSGMVASVLTTPFDVVKTHRQITLGSADVSKRMTMMEAFRQLMARGGFSSLFAGVIPRAMKVAPACAIMIGSYEFFKLFFEKRNKAATGHDHHHIPSVAAPTVLVHCSEQPTDCTGTKKKCSDC